MSAEETFRRVLAARLPAGPGWAAWIDGTVTELVRSVTEGGIVLSSEEADLAHGWSMTEQEQVGLDPEERALQARLEEAS